MAQKDRKKPRAIVRFASQFEKELCMVVDLSVTGARVHIRPQAELPKKFQLKIKILPELDYLYLDARRVWRQKDLAGVHFDKLSPRNYKIIESLVRIHRAEISNNVKPIHKK
jgi:hypothetical protein